MIMFSRLGSTPLQLLCGLFCIAVSGCVGGGAGGGGGGGGGTPCALDGSCPQGMTCGGQYCIEQTDAGTTDTNTGGTSSGGTSSGADTGASSGVDTGSSSGSADAVATTSSSGADSSSSGGTSSGGTSSGGVDAGGSSGGVDTGASSSGGGSLKVATLQQSSDSKVCAKKDGSLTVIENGQIEDVIATQPPFKVGSNFAFHARPVSAPQVGSEYQGIKFFIHGGEPKISAGDRVAVMGHFVEYFCESEITASAKDVSVISSGTTPNPYEVKTSSISYNGDSEAFEGVLVKIINVKVASANYLGSDGKTHGGFEVVSQTDSSAVVHVDLAGSSLYTTDNQATKQLETTFSSGQIINSISGHLNYSFGEFVLIPRGDSDLVTQ